MKTTNISEYIVNELLTMFFPAIREFVKWVFLLLLSRLQPAFDRDRSLARRLLRRHSINQRITNSSPVKENNQLVPPVLPRGWDSNLGKEPTETLEYYVGVLDREDQMVVYFIS